VVATHREPLFVCICLLEDRPRIAFAVELKPDAGARGVRPHHLARLLHRLKPVTDLLLLGLSLLMVLRRPPLRARPPDLSGQAQGHAFSRHRQHADDLQALNAVIARPDGAELPLGSVREREAAAIRRAEHERLAGAPLRTGLEHAVRHRRRGDRTALQQPISTLPLGIVTEDLGDLAGGAAGGLLRHLNKPPPPPGVLQLNSTELILGPRRRARALHATHVP